MRVQGLGREDEQRAQNIALQYGLGKGDSLGSVANVRSIDDLAGLIYGGSRAKYAVSLSAAAPSSDKDDSDGTGGTLTIPGYGEVTYETAERMEKNGSITLVGVDASGNPLYVKNQLPQSTSSAYNDWLIQQQKR